MEGWIDSFGSASGGVAAVAAFLPLAWLLGSHLFGDIRHRPFAALLAVIAGSDLLCLLFSAAALLHFGLFKALAMCAYFAGLATAILILVRLVRASASGGSGIAKSAARRWPVFALALFALAFFGRACCPPAGWDELTYQLAVPRRWLQDCALKVYADNPYSGFPSASGVLFCALMHMGGVMGGRIFVWALWLLSLVSLYFIVRPGLRRTASFSLCAAFASSTAVLMAANFAYGEMFILVQLCGIIMLLKVSRCFACKDMVRHAALAGIFAGAAAAVKLTGIFVGVSFACAMFFCLFRARRGRSASAVLFFSSAAILFALPFYLRPWLETGNPFHPYFADVFGASPAAVEVSDYHYAVGDEKYGVKSPAYFLIAPLLLCFDQRVYDTGFDWQFLPVLATALACLAVSLRKGRAAKFASAMLVFAAAAYALWFVSSQQARFLIPAVFAVFAAAGAFSAALPRRMQACFSCLLLALSAASLCSNKSIFKDTAISWRTALGRLGAADYVYSSTGEGYLQALDMIRLKTPEGAKVMMIFENRGLYMPRSYVIGTPFFQGAIFTPPENFSEPGRAYEAIAGSGATHVLLGLSDSDPDRLPEYLDRSRELCAAIASLRDLGRLATLWEGGGYLLLEAR